MLYLSLLILPAQSLAQDRVALLIGNSRYARPEMSLRNPANDVNALGRTLRELGFAVTEATDQDLAGMEDALAAFAVGAQDAEMALFFYAGHGVQIGGDNHLVGTGFSGTDLETLRRSALTMGRVRDVMESAKPEIGILILDACRNNPFSEQGLVQQGLVRSRGGAGMLLAYATDPGNVAFDGAGDNSVFTSALLDHIATPGLDARLMLGRVRQQVVLNTGGQQVPWVEEAVLGEHTLAPAEPTDLPTDDIQAELALWRGISGSTDSTDFTGYLTSYPDGLFAGFARDRLALLSQPVPVTAGQTVQALLDSTEPIQVAAALTSLGLLSPQRARSVAEDLGPALEVYRRQLPDPTDLNTEQLYTDAARTSMFLAATTLQRIRTDMVALRSVDRTLAVALEALAQIEEIAKTNADALPILQTARHDVEDIYKSRAIIHQRLDQSRSYYDEILNRSVIFFPKDASIALIGGETRARELGQTSGNLLADANLFLRHVSDSNDETKGSYKWLTDLIPSD
jgi:caspase domain-containing protein